MAPTAKELNESVKALATLANDDKVLSAWNAYGELANRLKPEDTAVLKAKKEFDDLIAPKLPADADADARKLFERELNNRLSDKSQNADARAYHRKTNEYTVAVDANLLTTKQLEVADEIGKVRKEALDKVAADPALMEAYLAQRMAGKRVVNRPLEFAAAKQNYTELLNAKLDEAGLLKAGDEPVLAEMRKKLLHHVVRGKLEQLDFKKNPPVATGYEVGPERRKLLASKNLTKAVEELGGDERLAAAYQAMDNAKRGEGPQKTAAYQALLKEKLDALGVTDTAVKVAFVAELESGLLAKKQKLDDLVAKAALPGLLKDKELYGAFVTWQKATEALDAFDKANPNPMGKQMDARADLLNALVKSEYGSGWRGTLRKKVEEAGVVAPVASGHLGLDVEAEFAKRYEAEKKGIKDKDKPPVSFSPADLGEMPLPLALTAALSVLGKSGREV